MDEGCAFFFWIGIVVVFAGVVLYDRESVLSWAEHEWRLIPGPIHYGPVGATCYGTEPTQSYRHREGHYGSFGIVGDRLVFSTRSHEDFTVPLASITWIGIREIAVNTDKSEKEVTALVVQGEYQHDWFVLALTSDQLFTISQQLMARCNLRVEELGERSGSRGPVRARRVRQDIYGEWHEEVHGSLFLAPDRLLFCRLDRLGTSIFLTQIREIGAFSKGGVLNSLNPFAEDLLRIEYQPTPDGKPEVIGFLVRNADDWAAAIRARSPARITVHAGRKKKVG